VAPAPTNGALADALGGLSRDVRRLADALAAASLAGTDDRPPEDVPAAVEACTDAVGDLHVLVHEILDGLPLRTSDLGAAREGLIGVHARVNRMREPMRTATSYESIASITRVGQTRRRAWQAWASAMRDSLDRLQHEFSALDERLLACWTAVSRGDCRDPR